MTIDEIQTPTAPAPEEQKAAPTAEENGTAVSASAPTNTTDIAADLTTAFSSAPSAEPEMSSADMVAPGTPATDAPAPISEANAGIVDAPEAPVDPVPAATSAPTETADDISAAQPTEAHMVSEAPVEISTPPVPATVPGGDSNVSPENTSTPTPAAPQAAAPQAAAPKEEAPRAEPGVKAANDLDLFDQYMSNPASVDAEVANNEGRRLQRGERVDATVIQVEGERVFVDLGSKSEGIIPSAELSGPASDYKPGDKVNVIVIKPEGGDSPAQVSRKRAEVEEMWDGIVSAFEEKRAINAPVVERVKGGLTVDLGMPGQSVRGFVPATHVGNGKIRNLDRFQGETLELKIIELDRERKKVVLSNREAEAESRAVKKDQIFGTLKVDDVLEGQVRRLTDYGAFVDLGGVDGLLHISEMSWARIGHPKEIFKEGDTIKVKVLRLDKGTEKISLGHKQVLDDPWQTVRTAYTIGQTLKVNITRVVASGAFIRLPEGAEAFMPVSEMSENRVNDAAEVFEPNAEVECKIIELKPEARRMVLSVRAMKPGYTPRPDSGYRGEADFRSRGGAGGPGGGGRGRPGGGRDGGEDSSRRGMATGGATIGERLGMLKGLLRDGNGGSAGQPGAGTEDEK